MRLLKVKVYSRLYYCKTVENSKINSLTCMYMYMYTLCTCSFLTHKHVHIVFTYMSYIGSYNWGFDCKGLANSNTVKLYNKYCSAIEISQLRTTS